MKNEEVGQIDGYFKATPHACSYKIYASLLLYLAENFNFNNEGGMQFLAGSQ
jgi:hypothetical protein